LSSSWWGRVWLNPQYGDLGPRFIRKLTAEIRNGDVEQACVLLAAAHLTSNWFHDAVDGLDQTQCIIRGRLRFSGPNSRSGPAHGSVVIGLAVSQQRFAEAFSPLGIVMRIS
jgi:hypothetical protein